MSKETPLTTEDVDLDVYVNSDTNTVQVEFSGFDDTEDAEKYAQFLVDTLPLLLFETTKIH